MLKYKLILVSLLFFQVINAQELNCNVQINSQQVQGTNKSVFNTLKKSITDFLNNRRWTNLSFAMNERIECSMNIIVAKVDNDAFTAQIEVQSRRPVYDSNYKTTLFNFKDNSFNFKYKEFDKLEFDMNNISSNLTAVLAYYAYIIIGYDMDSFSSLGGTPYFQKAEDIVNAAQSADLDGWKAFESSHNRYALISNLTDEAFNNFRNYFYVYHRLGLDQMTINVDNARAKIADGLHILRDANRARPNALIISTFMDAKSNELVNIFSQAPEAQKKQVVDILSDVDPTHSDRYEKILQ